MGAWRGLGAAALVLLLLVLLFSGTVIAEPKGPDRSALKELLEHVRERESRSSDEIAERVDRSGWALRADSESSSSFLVGFFAGRPLWEGVHNLDAADTVDTDEVWPGGSLGLELDGSGQILGLWDSGRVRAAHQELAGRVFSQEAASLNDHSTHVAGTLIAVGVDPDARGMAGAAELRTYRLDDDEAEMIAEQLLPDPIALSNHSYGYITGWTPGSGSYGCSSPSLPHWFGDVDVSTEEDVLFGHYHEQAREWDAIVWDSPGYLPVKSAGNDRDDIAPFSGAHCHWDGSEDDWVVATDLHPDDGGELGFDTISGGQANAKNVLTVGAVTDEPGGWPGPEGVFIANFSGWGPTDDGRIKPDLVANGLTLRSSASSANDAYLSFSGTSMAAPNVTGSLALLRQHAANLGLDPPSAAFLKALAIHAANETGPAPGPDYQFGWGLFTTAGAADILTAQAAARWPFFHAKEETLGVGEALEHQVWSDGSGPLMATIAWTDLPGPLLDAGQLDPPDAVLVHDLDLELVGPSGAVHQPWVLDPGDPGAPAGRGDNDVDNVEQVVVDDPLPGLWRVRVVVEGELQEEQAFALMITGNVDLGILVDGFESGDTGAW